MQIFRLFIWTGFIICLLVFVWYHGVFASAGVAELEGLGNPDEPAARSLLQDWAQAGLSGRVRWLMKLDFLFVICYVSLLVYVSAVRMRQEPSPLWNSLLRANYFFAFAAGISDCAENGTLLYNLSLSAESGYWHLWWITWMKWGFAGWAVIVWLLASVRFFVKKFR